MKFKFIGNDESYCLELMAYGLEKKGEYLKKNQIIEVPDDAEVVINALDANGLFERYNTPKKVKKENE